MLEKYLPSSLPPDSTSYMPGAYANISPYAAYLDDSSDITGVQSMQFVRDATDPGNIGRDIGIVLRKVGIGAFNIAQTTGSAISRLGRYIHQTLTFPGAAAEPLTAPQGDVTAEFRDATSLVQEQLSAAHRLYDAGDYTAALEQLRDIPSDSKDSYNYALRGETHYKLKHFEEGVRDLSKAIERDAELRIQPNHKTHYLLAECQYSTGNYTAARKNVNRAIRILKANEHTDSVEYRLLATSSQYHEAEMLHDAGKSKEALNILSPIVESARDTYNYGLRAEIRYMLGYHQEAIDDLDHTIGLRIRNGMLPEYQHYVLRANAHYRLGNHTAAAQDFTEILHPQYTTKRLSRSWDSGLPIEDCDSAHTAQRIEDYRFDAIRMERTQTRYVNEYSFSKKWSSRGMVDEISSLEGETTLIPYRFDMPLTDYTRNCFRVSATEERKMLNAMRSIEQVANVRFVPAANDSETTQLIAIHSCTNPPEWWMLADAHLDSTQHNIRLYQNTLVRYGAETLLNSNHTNAESHELMHILGLNHVQMSSEWGVLQRAIFPGPGHISQNCFSSGYNYDNSIMSYTPGMDTYADFFRPRIRDVWLLQALYGPSTENSGDTTYRFDGYNRSVTIVDNGGINTFENIGTTSFLDLFPRSYFNLNSGDIRSFVGDSAIRTEGRIHRVIGGKGRWRHVVHGSVTHGNEINLSHSVGSQHVFTAGHDNLVRFSPGSFGLNVLDCRSGDMMMVPGTDVIWGFNDHGRLQVEDNIRWRNISFSHVNNWRHHLHDGSTTSTLDNIRVRIDGYPQSIVIAGTDQFLTPCHFIGRGDLNPRENGCETPFYTSLEQVSNSFSSFYMQAVLGMALAFRKEFFSRVGSAVQAGAVRLGLSSPASEQFPSPSPSPSSARQALKVIASMARDAAILTMRQKLPVAALVHDLMQSIKWSIPKKNERKSYNEKVTIMYSTVFNALLLYQLHIPYVRRLLKNEFYAVPEKDPVLESFFDLFPKSYPNDSWAKRVANEMMGWGLGVMRHTYVVRQLVPYLARMRLSTQEEEIMPTAHAAHLEVLNSSTAFSSNTLRRRHGAAQENAGQGRAGTPVEDIESQYDSKPATVIQGKGIICSRRNHPTIGKVREL